MKAPLRTVLLLALSCSAFAEAAQTSAAAAKPTEAAPIAPPDLAALIECKKEVADFLALDPAVRDPLKAVALGWKPLPQVNQFMTEFQLLKPITVFGHATDHIAFAGDSIMAILDLPDPRPLAHQLDLETGLDTPQKAIFGKQLRETEQTDPASGQTLIQAIILNVSNVASHPGKTLAGCSYNLDTEGPDPAPETAAPALQVKAAPAP
ncbi:hypothetical protein [Pseudoxanthomonas sp.]|uniref:hypothetical protein n=1 Tax=Pseudoxanthomonas sp. TaxID=1871049 RepID=UPI00260DACC9|nr:hypothetical protein [Pseudoxanthomonas sp.]WDS36014.1 MAG: hypothetical protein O8I58_17190 [Pseudoxanthomonas sp.]